MVNQAAREENSYNKTILANSVDATGEFAADFAKWLVLNGNLYQKNVVCLRGNLGAGKTTFVKAFANAIGIDPSIVKSPTYTYFRKYAVGDITVYHFDYYRIEDLNKRDIEEFLEIVDGNNLVLIEWPDRIEEYLPDDHFEVELEVVDENKRKISINEN
ncbi:tRNA (adenosine(37)-N6)-threonylcarbamoyltransferase complex ATPase subunit type 1 TsaE [Patescibacteria group bacterium]|nr:tRNA (adenosine(37)-N6)-threonylcarbamoyltransferase complex ATPase subunit type 1 TsaE [Patescibacteria group bacterium]